jgi:hypothetical protein
MEKQTKKARPHHLYLIQGTPQQKKETRKSKTPQKNSDKTQPSSTK